MLQRLVGGTDRQTKIRSKITQRERSAGSHPAADQLAQRIRNGGHLGGNAGWDGDAEAVAKQRRIECLGQVLAAADAHGHHAFAQAILECHARDGGILRELIHRDRPHDAQRVRELFGGVSRAQTAEGVVDFLDHGGVEKLAQLDCAQQFCK